MKQALLGVHALSVKLVKSPMSLSANLEFRHLKLAFDPGKKRSVTVAC